MVMMADQRVRANNDLTMLAWILQLPKQSLIATAVTASEHCIELKQQNSQKAAVYGASQLIF